MTQPLVEVDGLRQLRRSLRRAGEHMTEIKAANKAAADHVSAATKPPQRSGALAATVRTSGTNTAGIVRVGKKRVPYANPIHWGWPARNIEAQPFVTDAAQATEPQWTEIYLQHINDILDRIEREV